MKTTLDIIDRAARQHPRFTVAYSGGSDSNVLLDILFHRTPHRPAVIFADSQLEYPGTLEYLQERCASYGATLKIARAKQTPVDIWRKHGWPFWGKQSARLFMQKNPELGVRCDVSTCCRKLKIEPARRLSKALGATAMLVGTKGKEDDALRGLRAVKDGATVYVKQDDLVSVAPLTGWTDTMVRRYLRVNGISSHPAKRAGALTIGCVVCGGGAQFDNSGWRILRRTWPEGWRWFFVACEAGPAMLAVKYRRPLKEVLEAIAVLGGLEKVAETRPWLFDFLQVPPKKGYDK